MKLKTLLTVAMLALVCAAFNASTKAQSIEHRMVYGQFTVSGTCSDREFRINVAGNNYTSGWNSAPWLDEDIGGYMYVIPQWEEIVGQSNNLYVASVADVSTDPDVVVYNYYFYLGPNDKLELDLVFTYDCQ